MTDRMIGPVTSVRSIILGHLETKLAKATLTGAVAFFGDELGGDESEEAMAEQVEETLG